MKTPSLFLCFLAFFFLASCNSYQQLAQRYDIKKAKMQVDNDLKNKFAHANYHRFTISSQTPQELFFAARCAFEEKGFKYVGYSERPDFTVEVQGSLPYRLTYIPPKETLYERLDADGFIVQKHFSSPAYAERFFQPKLQVRIYDFKDKSLVWQSSGSGEVREEDKNLSQQILLRQALNTLPEEEVFATKKQHYDLQFVMLSKDKKSYYPVVVQNTISTSLKEGDEITEIDGIALGSLSASQVYQLLERKQRSARQLGVSLKRGRETLALQLDTTNHFPSASTLEFKGPKNPFVARLTPYEVLRGRDPLQGPKRVAIVESFSPHPLELQDYPKEAVKIPKELSFLENLERSYEQLEVEI